VQQPADLVLRPVLLEGGDEPGQILSFEQGLNDSDELPGVNGRGLAHALSLDVVKGAIQFSGKNQ
jgi:hypothetical protein